MLLALNYFCHVKGKMTPTKKPTRKSALHITVNPIKAVQPDVPEVVDVPVLNKPLGPSKDNPFHPGDNVIYKFNQKGTVVSVEGDGVQVDFGLGIHYLSYAVLRLSQN